LHLFEFFFRGFVAGVQVGVILARELAVGGADILLRRAAVYAEDFVKIAFGRGWHWKLTSRGRKIT
jgi:hypothetical protein